jgi:hypothetical protein
LTAALGTTIVFTNKLQNSVEVTCDALEVDNTIFAGNQSPYTFKSTGQFTFDDGIGDTFIVTIVS